MNGPFSNMLGAMGISAPRIHDGDGDAPRAREAGVRRRGGVARAARMRDDLLERRSSELSSRPPTVAAGASSSLRRGTPADSYLPPRGATLSCSQVTQQLPPGAARRPRRRRPPCRARAIQPRRPCSERRGKTAVRAGPPTALGGCLRAAYWRRGARRRGARGTARARGSTARSGGPSATAADRFAGGSQAASLDARSVTEAKYLRKSPATRALHDSHGGGAGTQSRGRRRRQRDGAARGVPAPPRADERHRAARARSRRSQAGRGERVTHSSRRAFLRSGWGRRFHSKALISSLEVAFAWSSAMTRSRATCRNARSASPLCDEGRARATRGRSSSWRAATKAHGGLRTFLRRGK